jgi:hypothetical protein
LWGYPHLDVAGGQREKSKFPKFCISQPLLKNSLSLWAGMSERKRPVLKPPKSKATSTTAAVNTLEVTTKAVVTSPAVEEEPELQDNATTPAVDSPPPRRKHRRAHHQHHHLHEQKSLSDVGEDLHIDSQRRIIRSRGSTHDGDSIAEVPWKWGKEHAHDDAVDATLQADSAQTLGRVPTTKSNPPSEDDPQHRSEAMAALKDAASGMHLA